jgi:hypothetical protein
MILRCDDEGNLSILAGSREKGHRDGDAKQALFSWPRIVPHPQGGYWVTHGGLSLRRFREGTVSTVIHGRRPERRKPAWQYRLPPLPEKGFDGICGAAAGPDGNLYVLELRSVSKVTPGGKMEKVLRFGGAWGEGDWGAHDFLVLPDGSFVSTHLVYCR